MNKNYALLLFFVLSLSFGCESNPTNPKCEINVKQNSTIIVNGGSFDFGQVNVNANSSKITFTIENVGKADLQLTGNPYKIAINGTDSSMFTIDETMTQASIAGNDSTTFSVTFQPTSEGVKTAEISIPNNDTDENPYKFTISGTGIGLREINIKQNNIDIVNNSVGYDFGSIEVNQSSSTITFTIENLGSTTLQLTNTPNFIEITGADAAMFTLNQTMTNGNIAPGSTTSFEIVFSPTSIGDKTATVSIANDDNDENPYEFTIKGKCTQQTPEINVKHQTTNIPCTTGSYDFGTIHINGMSANIEFTIENLGSGNLELNGSYKIDMTGTDKMMFLIDQSMTDAMIMPGNSTRFMIMFIPTIIGNKSATVTIANNDSDENPYTFEVKGDCTVTGKAIGWIGGGKNGWQTTTAPSSSGMDHMSFAFPKSSCIDSAGTIYTADTGNHRVSKWDSSGTAKGWIGGAKSGWQTGITFSSGTDYKSFNQPSGVCVNSAGNIYVADTANNRICVWDKNGNPLGWFGGGSNGLKTSNAPAAGNDYMSFNAPKDVCVDASDNIYVADSMNNRICKWDKGHKAIGWIGGGKNGWSTSIAPAKSTDYQSFDGPSAVSLDTSENIYVADTANHRACKWDKNGNAKGWIGGAKDGWQTSTGALFGQDYKSFLGPCGIAVNSSTGAIYVVDTYNYRVCKWDGSGNAKGWIGGGKDGWQTGTAPTWGPDLRSFEQIFGVCLDSAGNLYVTDTLNYRVSKWSD